MPTYPWLDIDEQVSQLMAPIIGAEPSEVAVMQSLTANLHLAMSSFYKPQGNKRKILIEEKAFPSDHFAVESQIRQQGLYPDECMVVLSPEDREKWYFSSESVCKVIEKNKEELALILLPGVHFYSGQWLDIPGITAFAHTLGIPIGWDLAHAVGNVPLQLHKWGVDFAVWCGYKYLNTGPGGIGGLFVHSNHHDSEIIKPAFTGWWGSSKASRFAMDNVFSPMPGASAWQLSNPSVLDCVSLISSLSVFGKTTMAELRKKSVSLTAYLEFLLLEEYRYRKDPTIYTILTPEKIGERGSQISIKLREGLLEKVVKELGEEGVVVDERRPDVIRVAPIALYNSFADVWKFVDALWRCIER
jgi:kynureninase